jgi:lycopene beta-cyclase
MKGEYFLVLGAILFFPLVLSLLMRLRLFQRWRALLKAMLFVSAVYWVWDIAAIARGHWSFNPAYILGVDLLGMPVEEWLFFVVITFVSVFTHEAVGVVLGRAGGR